jgi:hypothetical protein
MSLAIPTEQFRTEYTFLAPASYDVSFVNVTAPSGQDVSFDGASIPPGEWTDVGATGMRVARFEVAAGPHTMTSGAGFGVVVYGFGAYTSYMYPGGLDLEEINIPF